MVVSVMATQEAPNTFMWGLGSLGDGRKDRSALVK